ncbi:SO_0444 family Cu/Zn efflux transporter [Paraglaciecola hydrolytica]|uniref:Permease n=1 Tax=Paraglaciecola hydrolytica TaxID=1799789 RepID=A0A136A361_9ALTE|nr:SO_0444 family Cu/Zn efflux transporter [Paraglaciecola hydrolytica]KXI29637.1 permease [Paraglaciecola hydrolytica]
MFVENFVNLFTEAAPFLLLGMLIAGAIHQLVPATWINKTLGKQSSVLNAAIIGAPLPLCSCSVIPVAMGIRRSGASKASTASFLVATPETGIDSVGITYALMGPVMTIARPIAAIFSAIITGSMIRWFGNPEVAVPMTQPEVKVSSCCASKTAPPEPSMVEKIISIFSFGFGQLLRDFMLWLLIGLGFAALVTTLVPPDYLAQYGQGVVAMLVVVLISIPMYICATASTPVAVGLLLSGITPGAALVFMLTGPATNIATLMVIKKELGGRELFIYLVSITLSALVAGLTLDFLFDYFGWQMQLAHGGHEGMLGFVYQASAVILALLMGFQLYKTYMPKTKDCCAH